MKEYHKQDILSVIEVVERWIEENKKNKGNPELETNQDFGYNSALSDLLQFLSGAKEGINKEN
jgi:hypothetical protein